ncbi:MAG: PD-(D/E)XK nuclease family protein [Bacteroidetes bacterium]|nr:PD-(D/E)XK nuclease family protein [Bacteroidota bacterium]
MAALLLFIACSRDELIARVNEHELFQSDLNAAMRAYGLNYKNKAEIQKFVNDWCQSMAMADELDANFKNLSQENKIRTDLFLGELAEYALTENKLLQKIDTVVTEEQLKTYYESHAEEFTLQDFIIKVLFLKISKKAPVIEKVKTAFLLKNDKDIAKIESYAKLYAEDFYFDDENWVFFTKIRNKIPIKGVDKDNMVLNRTKTYYTDDEYVYFINILDYKVKDDVSPLDFVRVQVKDRILINRMNEKREKIQTQLNLEIKNKHAIEIFL